MDNLNTNFKDLTRNVSEENDTEKATTYLVNGIADQLGRLKTNGIYPTDLIDGFIEQMRAHAPMWSQAVTVVGPTGNKREPQGR